MNDDEPLIKKQIDMFCKVLLIVSGHANKSEARSCETNLENTLATTSDLTEFNKEYIAKYGKDNVDKSYAITHFIMEMTE